MSVIYCYRFRLIFHSSEHRSQCCLQVGCNSTGLVCGVDGNTYPSECVAFAESMSVDYAGPCATSGFIGHNGRPNCARGVVNCPKLPEQGCLGVTPPGACCPKCTGALRIMFRYITRSHEQNRI